MLGMVECPDSVTGDAAHLTITIAAISEPPMSTTATANRPPHSNNVLNAAAAGSSE